MCVGGGGEGGGCVCVCVCDFCFRLPPNSEMR